MAAFIKPLVTWLFPGLILLSIFSACRKDDFYTSPDARLGFSNDTILFDTVFTAIGSATRALIVHNPYKDPIVISSIRLAGGDASPFRMNVDGVPGIQVKDIEIAAKDSVFVFVEVTVDPNGENSPVVIQDSILFELNGSLQDVDLVAFGQDYHLFNGEYVQTQTWINDKPYLIYNSIAVDTQQVLTISKGCRIHFHHNSSLFVLGTLSVEGSLEEPVVFQGDRLEQEYQDIPGQWGYIHLLAGSKDNSINHAIIRNSIIGIQVDTVVTPEPCLRISNSEIRNVNAVGLLAQGSKIVADNCLFVNCGQVCVALTIGGDYSFFHCTIGNYWPFSTRVTPALVLNNYYRDINQNYQIRSLNSALFENCIIYGNREEEILFDRYPDQTPLLTPVFQFHFDHCLARLDPETIIPSEAWVNSHRNREPGFLSVSEGDFDLDTLSFVQNKGKQATAQLFPFDLKGRSRISDAGPDLGCYERQDAVPMKYTGRKSGR